MGNGRVLAVGDIHSAYLSFRSLLELIRLKRTDTLYLLGDYCDRLFGAKEVLDTIFTFIADGYDLKCLKGNHEDLLVTAADSGVYEDNSEFLSNGGFGTLVSFGVDHVNQIPPIYLDFMRQLPIFLQNDTHVFVHAGLPCRLDEPISAIDRHEILWRRCGAVNAAYLAGRTLVSAHTALTLDRIKASLRTRHWRIDGGCCYGTRTGKGLLVAVDLNTTEIFAQRCIDDIDF